MRNICKIEECVSFVQGNGYCSKHNQKYRKYGDPLHVVKQYGINKGVCSVDSCEIKAGSGGMCYTHYSRMKNHGSTEKPTKSRGGWLDSKGYRILKHNGKNVFMHRLVMEQHLNRPLLSHENVHHINENRDDNTISNLELWSTSQPPGQRVADKVEWAKSLLALYEPESLAALTLT